MTGPLGGVVFVACTGALALWVVVRRPWYPRSLPAVIGHAIVALSALEVSAVAVRPDSPSWWRFTWLLVIFAPALTYVWLSAAWTALFARSGRRGAAR